MERRVQLLSKARNNMRCHSAILILIGIIKIIVLINLEYTRKLLLILDSALLAIGGGILGCIASSYNSSGLATLYMAYSIFLLLIEACCLFYSFALFLIQVIEMTTFMNTEILAILYFSYFAFVISAAYNFRKLLGGDRRRVPQYNAAFAPRDFYNAINPGVVYM